MSRRQVLRITAVAGISLALGSSVTAGLLRRARLHRVRVTRIQMGTRVTIEVVHPYALEGREMVAAAFTEMDHLEAILSRHRPDTAVARLNRDGVPSRGAL